jgi:hypothetical protein
MPYKFISTTEMFHPKGIKEIKALIIAANDEAPIAVFTIVRDGIKHLAAVFADTRHTYQLIIGEHPDLVGVFHRLSDLNEVKAKLNTALK